jgi:hypothetical protein
MDSGDATSTRADASEPDTGASGGPDAGRGDPSGLVGPEPGDRRPARLLDAPPSHRYTRMPGTDAEADDQPSELRGIVLAILVAAFCGLILVVLGGAFDFTAGLIVVAFFLGRLTATAMKLGAGSTISGARILAASVGIALAGVVLAQLGLWVWARWEGGSLDPVDFLAQTYGVLVILELLLAGGAAWLKAS